MLDTRKTRLQIGFHKEKNDWVSDPVVYNGHTLKIGGHPVMEDWESNYMESLVEYATSCGGVILELGYGMGISTKAIQKRNIDSHYVIECHPGVVKKALLDMSSEIMKNKIHFLTGFWEDVTPILKDSTFNGMLFDTYPLSEEQIHANHFWFFKEAHRLLKQNGVFTYYSDEAEEFSDQHYRKLLEAGFLASGIDFEVCKVKPPTDCEYWQKETMIVPHIKKR